ncbi:hypothetical protein GCM10023085_09410 [Actinomadura viridis]|uniref:Anti-sigma regulatory factor (Ser/Thr protein kinase) n=1 Tax=Actinomadura viridis TaxID=58110 RepID=A0A931GLE0_9ACTN|nr:ATP-binding protein [Actinomadura viridis]MBG6091953.1 anti-sigma regulatory factor (Ser/Thr protein kinase) [Actinomadura viridis]
MGVEAGISGEMDIAFLAARTAPGWARSLIELRLTDWGMGRIAADVCLVAGELIANAVESTPDAEIRIRFTREPMAVLLAVWDSSDAMPAVTPVRELTLEELGADPRALDPGHDDGTGGWGLPIVQALSAACGVRVTEPRGKWVWARIAC